MDKSKQVTITISGPQGSGKSTMMERISRNLTAKGWLPAPKPTQEGVEVLQDGRGFSCVIQTLQHGLSQEDPAQKIKMQVENVGFDLAMKVRPLQAISVIRAHCSDVLQESETMDFEEKTWSEVTQLLDQLQDVNRLQGSAGQANNEN